MHAEGEKPDLRAQRKGFTTEIGYQSFLLHCCWKIHILSSHMKILICSTRFLVLWKGQKNYHQLIIDILNDWQIQIFFFTIFILFTHTSIYHLSLHPPTRLPIHPSISTHPLIHPPISQRLCLNKKQTTESGTVRVNLYGHLSFPELNGKEECAGGKR